MVKRAIFYDDCRDASRLAAEYTLSGTAPNVYLDGNRFCYRWDATGFQTNRIVLMGFEPSKEFELTFLFKKNAIAVPAYGDMDIWWAYRAGPGTYYQNYNTDVNYFIRQPENLGKWFTYVMNNAVWYVYKLRVSNANVLAKHWLLGTSEPDWMFNCKQGPFAGGNESSLNLLGKMSGKIAFAQMARQAGEYLEIADIRITPIPRTGGP